MKRTEGEDPNTVEAIPFDEVVRRLLAAPAHHKPAKPTAKPKRKPSAKKRAVGEGVTKARK